MQMSSHATCALHGVAATDRYDRLKKFLIWAFSPIQHQRVTRLMSFTDLGDHSSTQFADLMWHTLGDYDANILLPQIFGRSLPPYVQDALLISTATSLDTLTEEAK